MTVFYTDNPVADEQRYDAMWREQDARDTAIDLEVQQWILNPENAHKVSNDDWTSWGDFSGMSFDDAMCFFVEEAFGAKFDANSLTTKQKDSIISRLFGHIKQGAIDYANFELCGF